MPQFNKLQFTVLDDDGNAIPNASIDVRNQGATVNGTQAGPIYTVDDTGSITTASQVQAGTTATPTRNVTAVAVGSITVGVTLGTINDDGRIVVVTPAVTLYNDCQGNEGKNNPLTTDASGKAYCWVALNKVDVIYSATGYATTIEYDRQATGTEYQVSNVFDNATAVAFKIGTSATLSNAGALIASWNNPIGSTPPRASIGLDGTITSRGNLSILGTSTLTGAVTASAAVSVAGLLTASNSFTYSGAAGSMTLTAGCIETADLAANSTAITYTADGTADQNLAAGGAYADVTGATVTMTPFSTASEIFVYAVVPWEQNAAAAGIGWSIIADASNTVLYECSALCSGAAAGNPFFTTLVYRVTGLAASPQTFKIRAKATVANMRINDSTNGAAKRVTRIVVVENKR